MSRADCVEELAAEIVAARPGCATRVAIDGVDGSGKTTLSDELVEPIRRAGREVIRASIDGFHNPRAVRYVRGSDSPEGYFLDSFDYAALRRELLEPLARTERQPEFPNRRVRLSRGSSCEDNAASCRSRCRALVRWRLSAAAGARGG